ncbi:MAG: bifunctional phosphoribosylaminoimidazolecarboxamide formyltransferase/inosine monophosphate cyclohydrolase [Flavobacteriaceae bacterium]|nr:MAG: bifunctional phosphoribosylaminoimidazolecarboxamide formyltransferase/inosine monophosphate cyclohydrolase [Flavobacteriaceae bacterium]
MQKQALLSVSDKSNLIEFAQFLEKQNYKILSTGGTLQYLLESGVKATSVGEITNFPEILDGRVKTLHPAVHGGILARRNSKEHMETLEKFNLSTIDVVVVNLYPFFENADKELKMEELVEFIDIGGPTMLRAAAKSFFDVTVITEASDYALVQEQLEQNGETTLELRRELAGKVFNLTSAYDGAISRALLSEKYPSYFNASFKKVMDLRYGENPHQSSAFYVDTTQKGAMKDFVQLGGKELSFNNIRDMDIAWKVANEFTEPAVCAVKHSTPCGVAVDSDIVVAYQKAHDCDPMSIFGGIVAVNQKVTKPLAEKLVEIFLEIVVATDFEKDALEVLSTKKNLRIIQITQPISNKTQIVTVDGGILVQDTDNGFSTDLKTVTEKAPTDSQMKDLIFAQKVIKHVKSNAIVVASGQIALGVGTGQTNRIWAAQHAVERAKEKMEENFPGQNLELVLASEAFFPFRDVVDFAAEKGISAIIQPGGSIKDADSIAAANEHGIAMVTTGMRHFLH